MTPRPRTHRLRPGSPRLLIALLVSLTLSAAATTRAASLDAYQQLVTDLAAPDMEGRGPGTTGIDRARDYLVERFRSVGLKPAFAQGQSFTQAFDVPLGAKAEQLALALTPTNPGAAVVAEAHRQVVATGFSGSGAFAGPLVFVGYGVVQPERSYDSYAPLAEGALRGKVALAFRYEPMDGESQSLWNKDAGRWSEAASLTNKARWAAERGATALLLINPPGMKDSGMITTARTAVAGPATIPVAQVDADWFAAVAPKLNLVTLQRQADREPVTQELALSAEGEVRMVRPQARVDNVAGVLSGAGALADEVVVVGAHYDHLGYGEFGSLYQGKEPAIHHGADDNASGVAAIVLVAQELARAWDTEAVPAPRRTVLFIAFSGEERGLLGSSHFLERLSDTGLRLEQLVAMVNLDMVGRMKDDTLHVLGSGSGEGLPQLAKAAAGDLKLDLRMQEVAPGGSDHVSFHVRGVPAMHLFTGGHGDYHRPSDTADKINAEGGLKVTGYTRQLVRALAVAPTRPKFVAQEAFAHHAGPGGPSGGAVLGVMPDYASLDGDDGAIITAVSPGSPAEKAGLHSGDVIVGWDEQKVANVRHLTELLGQAKPRQEVRLTVRRGEQLHTLTAKLGGR